MRRSRHFLAAAIAVAGLAVLATLPAVAAPPDRPDAVALLRPTTAEPATVAASDEYDVTISTPSSGAWALEQRPSGAGADFAPVADGVVDAAGEHTLAALAPEGEGRWDLRVRFMNADGKRTKDVETEALVVDAPPGPEVTITEPGNPVPAIVPAGTPVRVSFTSSSAGRYSIRYRDATGTETAFPDGTGTLLTRGTKTTAVRAPASSGAWDLVVEVVDGRGRTDRAVAPQALVVLGPTVTEDQRCDPIDPAHCLLPFPNDHFTAADPTTTTGRRVNLNVLSMPRNVAGKPIVPDEWNRNDGFSPGSMVLTFVPGLDLHSTWGETTDHITDIARYTREDAPIVIVNTKTGERHPFWSELDTHPDTTDARRLLILRPARNFDEGTRYVVALRDMRDVNGAPIEPNPVFTAMRDRVAGLLPTLGDRQAAMERVFDDLDAAGVARDDLYLAWDFTVASADNIAGRVLHMRDEMLADFDSSVAVKSVTKSGNRIDGVLSVPSYLSHDHRQGGYEDYSLAVPGSRMLFGADGKPMRNPAPIDVPFLCQLPSGTTADNPARPMLYGHGLLGSRGEAEGSSTNDMRQRGFAACAIDWMGMAFSDVPNVGTILADVSNFPSLADRGQQGFLNWIALGRALKLGGVSPLLQSGELYYDGNSQGGIMGGALTALSPDFTRAVLGVPGMNYSTLLNRSVDWEGHGDEGVEIPEFSTDPTDYLDYVPPYATFMYASYPDKLEQQLVFSLIQMIWDRAEANGYAQHMTTSPYPGTPAHQVMLQVAFSDHQVANIAAEVEARTIGAKLSSPSLDAGRHWSVDPAFGFSTVSTDAGGSYIVYWDSTFRGLATPPNGNVPPAEGSDPHSDPRKDDRGSDQKAHFLLTGELVNVCGPCLIASAP